VVPVPWGFRFRSTEVEVSQRPKPTEKSVSSRGFTQENRSDQPRTCAKYRRKNSTKAGSSGPASLLSQAKFKDIENRTRRTDHRGPLLIHAGLNLDDCTQGESDSLEAEYGGPIRSELHTGGIVGVVDLIDCVQSHKSAKLQQSGQRCSNRARLDCGLHGLLGIGTKILAPICRSRQPVGLGTV
jgi:hypothetical protein